MELIETVLASGEYEKMVDELLEIGNMSESQVGSFPIYMWSSIADLNFSDANRPALKVSKGISIANLSQSL